MFKIVSLLQQSSCINRATVFRWFLARRFGISKRSCLVRMAPDGDREVRFSISDVPTLVSALKTFGKENPWAQWQPAKAPRYILDMGANMGIISVYFKWRFPEAKVVAVEMMPANAAAVEQAAKLNGLDITVMNVAVADREDEAWVRCNAMHTQNSLERLEENVDPRWGFSEKRVKVRTWPLARLLDELGWKKADFIKVDIEGAEKLLLADLPQWAHRVETVFMEIHHNVVRADAEAAMKKAGFRLFNTDESGRTELWYDRSREPI